MAQFREYNLLGVSSSLAQPAHEDEYWSRERSNSIVPVLTLKDIIESIPQSVKIQYIKMDLQGFDYDAIYSAGMAIQRVDFIMCDHEVWLGGRVSYDGVRNDLARDWYPHMTSMGLGFVKGKENCDA